MKNPDIEALKKGKEAWEVGHTLRDAGRIPESIEALKVAAQNGNPAGYIDLALIEAEISFHAQTRSEQSSRRAEAVASNG